MKETSTHLRIASLVLALTACDSTFTGDPGAADVSVVDEPPEIIDGVRSEEPDSDLSGDLRPEARTLIERRNAHSRTSATLADVDDAPSVVGEPPLMIRVWRRRLDGSGASCRGRVDTIPLEQYVKGVLPHEWIISWDEKALQMGAVVIRTYAWWWIAAGGKYDCADLDDTTASQVYSASFYPETDAAVEATDGMAVVRDGSLVFAEYSAENSNPTRHGVSEPLCSGQWRQGHGRGLCQWGSQRWATKEGRGIDWMTAHYYPGATIHRPLGQAPGGEDPIGDDPVAEGPLGTVRGFVRDTVLNDASKGLAAATVALSTGATTTTSADGQYRFDGVAPGDVTITASQPGFVTGERTVAVVGDEVIWGSIALIPDSP